MSMQQRGDAAGMRHAASQLTAKAERVTAVAGRLENQVAAMSFAGPAATRFRSVVADQVRRQRDMSRVLPRDGQRPVQRSRRSRSKPGRFLQHWGCVMSRGVITIDPKELIDTAVLLATSAVELADIGFTLRACTGCEMPATVRTSIDAVVATADRVLDDMAAALRSEAADLAQRAVVAANDMLTAAGYAPLPGTITPPTAANAGLIGGGNFGSTTSSSPFGSGGSFYTGYVGGAIGADIIGHQQFPVRRRRLVLHGLRRRRHRRDIFGHQRLGSIPGPYRRHDDRRTSTIGRNIRPR